MPRTDDLTAKDAKGEKVITDSYFIEYPEAFHREYCMRESAPLFRKRILLSKEIRKAVLSVCGLGYGYYYVNGAPVTEDLFTAPVSDYNKTLWYNTYDITEDLTVGDNVIAVILGNGFYNETLHTVWHNDEAKWRGLPKFCLELSVIFRDGTSKTVLSDETWLCSKDSPVLFNQLRSGETYDARIGEFWRENPFDDSGWVRARISEKPPEGVFRLCECEPIRKDTQYRYVSAFQNAENHWVLDFGQNISGFVQIRTKQPAGTVLLLRHAERLKSDGRCDMNGMDSTYYYQNGDFQVDRVICRDGVTEWEPRFTYHGFRYVEIEGLKEKPKPEDFTAVFVHQAVAAISEFSCSDETLNQLFKMGRISSWSNLFYMPTDCPTREKFGWANDAQASCEQFLQNFDLYKLLRKWLQDIFDAMLEDGALPGIIPSHGWGYDWGIGPISTGIIFELPYQMYRYTGQTEPMTAAYPYMRKHLQYINTHKDKSDGLIGYGLCDWAGPFEDPKHAPTPVKFTDTLLAIKFHRITAKAAKMCLDEKTAAALEENEQKLISSFKKAYFFENGRCAVSEQTAIAMAVAIGVYETLEPLGRQLKEEIQKHDTHLHCGMLGLQYLFDALDICGLSEYGVKMITADGFPSYKDWIEDGATTLYEHWNHMESNNHHMYSCILAWFHKTLVGFRLDKTVNAYQHAVIAPAFVSQLSFCSGRYKTASGEYAVSWERKNKETVKLDFTVPEGCTAELKLKGYSFENGQSQKRAAPGSYSIFCQKNR